MKWSPSPMPWSELENALSGRALPAPLRSDAAAPRPAPAAANAEGPAYAELHAHSHFSFLDGASSPESLVDQAVRLGLSGMAITDHDGLHGAAQFAQAAQRHPGFRTVFGAELSLGDDVVRSGVTDPAGQHLTILARGSEGYRRLSSAITSAQLAGGEKGRPVYDLEELADRAGRRWVVLTGCRKGGVPAALAAGDASRAREELRRLTGLFGRENVYAELIDHGLPTDQERNDALAACAAHEGVGIVATNNVHYALESDRRRAAVVAAVRARRSLDELDGWLPASGHAHLRSGTEMSRLFRRFPDALTNAAALAEQTAFDLQGVRGELPDYEVPDGHTPLSWLRLLVDRGAQRLYPRSGPEVRSRLERELAVIEAKSFSGYFLIVHDIVEFARRRGILCQGRGSAANSAVCYVLGITAVDSIYYDLPFERFLSSLREEEPDIDVDFDSARREEVIQYVYGRYGRLRAAQVANVITYRPRNAVRDVAAAFGHGPGQQDAWARELSSRSHIDAESTSAPETVVRCAGELLRAPRHLGIHSGGMVLTRSPVGEICPIEHARMPGRTVLQWDKDDCEWMGLVKFDLLGLGMLSALNTVFAVVARHCREEWSLATLPREEPAVYDMLCRGDALGVFQIESRAQLATLPRLRPREFYDLVIEIALIRPGPIQGGAVHPYLRRRSGQEEVDYMHPLLEPVLRRTLGIPLFQEQVMQMAVAVGGCTAEDADLLRRAMGSKRGIDKVEALRDTIYAGMADNGITGVLADNIYARIEAFANYGFAESHSLSFALLVYASSWLKLHYPAAFLVALLSAQPMGFYSPQSLVADAGRHGVEVRGVDVMLSAPHSDLEPIRRGRSVVTGRSECLCDVQPPVGAFDRSRPDVSRTHRRDGAFAVRLGLTSVTTVSSALADRIVAERDRRPFVDLDDFALRTRADARQLESLAAAGAFECLGVSQRRALWQAGLSAQQRPDWLPDTETAIQVPLLAPLDPAERTASELAATGMTTGAHPLAHLRGALTERGVRRLVDLAAVEPGRRVETAGLVIHRQRPATARGIVFLNLEDETGMLNVICSAGLWRRHRRVGRESAALIVRGLVERSPEGIVNLLADRLETLAGPAPPRSRDFR